MNALQLIKAVKNVDTIYDTMTMGYITNNLFLAVTEDKIQYASSMYEDIKYEVNSYQDLLKVVGTKLGINNVDKVINVFNVSDVALFNVNNDVKLGKVNGNVVVKEFDKELGYEVTNTYTMDEFLTSIKNA